MKQGYILLGLARCVVCGERSPFGVLAFFLFFFLVGEGRRGWCFFFSGRDGESVGSLDRGLEI